MSEKDVLSALGIVDAPKAGLGLETAGVIRRTGPNVKDLRAGGRVILFGGGSFSTIVTTAGQLCAKIPDNLDFNDGATMPVSAIYCLINVGRLEKGQVTNLC